MCSLMRILGYPSPRRSPAGSDMICASGSGLFFVPSLTIATRMPYLNAYTHIDTLSLRVPAGRHSFPVLRIAGIPRW